MKLNRSVIRFEFDDKTVELDVLQAKMDLEKLQEDSEADAKSVIDGVNDMFEEFDVNLTTSQAWQAIHAIDAGYECVKKKLRDTLESDFGTVPILLRSQNGSSNGLTDSSHSSSPSESCSIDTAKASLPEKE